MKHDETKLQHKAATCSSATKSQVHAQLRYIGLIRYADPDEKAMNSEAVEEQIPYPLVI